MKSLTKFHQNPTNLHTLYIHLEPFKVQLSEVFINSFVVIKLRLEVSRDRSAFRKSMPSSMAIFKMF